MEELVINPNKSLAFMRARAKEQATDYFKNSMLNFADHMEAECLGDLEALCATFSKKVPWSWNSYGENADPFLSPQGEKAVREYYQTQFDVLGGRINHDILIKRFGAFDGGVVMDGVVRLCYPGSLLKGLGKGEGVDDENAFYAYVGGICVIFNMDDEARCYGEDSYPGSDGFKDIHKRKLKPENIIRAERTLAEV